MLRRHHTLLFVLLQAVAPAQLVVNEACSKNLDLILDAFGATSDWVELHNSGSEPIHLAGYYLSDDPLRPHQWPLPDRPLGAGEHLVLFHGPDNSDGLHFPFKLDAAGETVLLSNPSISTIEMLHVPALQPNHSAGFDAAGSVRIFAAPTPGGSNTTTAYTGYAPTPQFTVQPGFKTAPLHVGITGCQECTVRLTTDGRDPDATSTVHTGSIHLTTGTVLKARAHRDGHLPSPVAVGTYLINAPTSLPVVSLSTHPDSLFHDSLGLYAHGPANDTIYPHWGANFWDERGIDVRFEYFDERGFRRLDQDVELRIHGGRSSRTKPQRPLRLTARDRYGSDRMRHGFFPEKPRLESFKRLVLRNAGSDWCQAHYRDAFFHQVALHAGLNIDVLAYRPSAVYVNGAYWGIMNIRERVDKDYLALNHDLDAEELLIMDEENHVIQGDSLHFDSLHKFIRSHDMAVDAHFAVADSLMDLKSLVDYFALEMFAGNTDWPSNNLKYWKPSVHSGKWRYVMYDLDATMSAAPWIPNDIDMFHWVLVHRKGFIHAEIFISLMERPEFRRAFLNRLADLMNTCLSSEALLQENSRIRDRIADDIPRHFQRWGHDVSTWHEQTGNVLPMWMELRAGYMREDVLQRYGFANTAQLRFDMFPREAGTLRVNTLVPKPPFDGIYFNGNDIDVSVEPLPGFRFSHWSYTAEPNAMRSAHLRRSFPIDGTLTAHFAKTDASFYAFPNPTTANAELSYEASTAGEIDMSLWDIQGRLLHERRIMATEGVNRIQLDLTPYAAGAMEARIVQNGIRRTARVMKH